MNSSMRQPSPVGKSLNDILMKGPSALADLFAVTLGFREYRYALTKDLSKFYNCVLADEEAQHTRFHVVGVRELVKQSKTGHFMCFA